MLHVEGAKARPGQCGQRGHREVRGMSALNSGFSSALAQKRAEMRAREYVRASRQVLYEDRCQKRKEKAAMLRKIFENLVPWQTLHAARLFLRIGDNLCPNGNEDLFVLVSDRCSLIRDTSYCWVQSAFVILLCVKVLALCVRHDKP